MTQQMAEHFGAKVRCNYEKKGEHQQLFLIRSSSGGRPLAGYVRSSGGKIFLQGSQWVLAELGIAEAVALKRLPGVAFVGGVHADPKRLELFRRVIGLQPAPQ